MNVKDKKLFEACKDVANRLDTPQISWLCSLVEELEAENVKVKGQRDRLAELLLRADAHLTHFPKGMPCLAHEVEKALAELEKET